MTQKYIPVEWTDETPTQPGTLINKARMDQMQSAHHFADGFEEVDAIPTEDPGTAYHKVVYCTADSTFYRWDGAQWTADIDDDTKRLLLEHEADHANPHQVTKAQVGLANADNTSDADKPISTATAAALATKAEDSTVVHLAGAETIDGKKTFTKNPVVSGAPPALTLINTLDTWVSPPSADAYASIGFSDKNNVAVGNVGTVHKTDTGERRTYLMARTSGGSVTAELDVVISSDGSTKYVTAPARAYNAANTGDVVTIGTLATPLALKADDNAVVHLNGAETIPGAKTFSGQMLATGQRAYDAANTTDVATIGTLDQYTPMVRTTGAQTIAGQKTYTSSTTIKTLGHSTTDLSDAWANAMLFMGSNDKNIASISPYFKASGKHEVRFYAYDSNNSSRSMVLSSEGYLTIPTRAYNTANNDDAVSIGLLKASTDVVHTSGPETIAGDKTFEGNIIKTATSGGIIIRSTDQTQTSPPAGNRFLTLAIVGSNNADLGTYGLACRTNGNREAYIQAFNADTTAQTLRIYALANGAGYMTGPSRAYNAANTTDVATIGTLDAYTPMVRTTGAQTIAGGKTFTSGIICSAYQAFTIKMTGGPRIGTNATATQCIMRLYQNAEDTDYVARDTIYQGANSRTPSRLWYLQRQNADGTGVEGVSLTLGFAADGRATLVISDSQGNRTII